MREWASASSQALPRLKFFADKLSLDRSHALGAFRLRVRTETVEADVPLLALNTAGATGPVIKGVANIADVAPPVIVDVFLGLFLDRLAAGDFRLVRLDFLGATEQRGDVEVVERQCVHHFPLQRRIFSEVFAAKTRARLHRIRAQTLGTLVKVFASL